MNVKRLVFVASVVIALSQTLARSQDIDKALTDLAGKIAATVKEKEKKKVAVIDFADLQGSSSGELGKYIAEELSVDLVMGKRDFSVLDRANLKKILAEHKLTATGLVDPDNAKKLGMFAGVDALVLGTIVPKEQNITVTAKIITTDTAEIIGAARAEFKADETVKGLMSHPAPENTPSVGANTDESSTMKTFGDLAVQMEPLRIVDENIFRLNLTLSNKNPKKSIWVALKNESQGRIHGTVTDSADNEFGSSTVNVSGITVAFLSSYNNNRMIQATEIRPGESISPTIKFVGQGRATVGTCRLQLELLVATSWNGSGLPTSHILATKIEAK